MNICKICNEKRLNKDILECAYCKNWFCDLTCAYDHLGECLADPNPLYLKEDNQK